MTKARGTSTQGGPLRQACAAWPRQDRRGPGRGGRDPCRQRRSHRRRSRHSDELRVLDKVGSVAADARHRHLAWRQLCLLPRATHARAVRWHPRLHLEDQIDDVLELSLGERFRRRQRADTAVSDPFRTLSMSPFPGLPRFPHGAGNRAIRKHVDHPAPNEVAIANPAARPDCIDLEIA